MMTDRLLPLPAAGAALGGLGAAAVRRLSPAQAAKRIGHGRGFVMALIKAGELAATDERAPGAARPTYRIDHDDLEAWQTRRTVAVSGGVAPVRTVRVTGLLARRRAKRRAAMVGQ